jgi:membrane dipeptidase
MDLILDAHLDVAYGALAFNREWTRSVAAQRQLEAGGPVEASEGQRVSALPEALIGNVGLVFGTLFVSPGPPGSSAFSSDSVSYVTPKEAYQKAIRQIDYYHRLADENAHIVLVRTQAELKRVLTSWGDDVAPKDRLFGIVVLMENGDPIVEPRQFEEWYERGVRLVGPAWKATRYCGGTGMPGGLTPLGRELLEVMASFNAILDISHMAEKAAYESLDLYEKTIIASHSNARTFVDTDRQLTDLMIRRLGERDGVIGIPMYNRFLKEGWLRSARGKAEVTLQHVVTAIDHVCQLTGSAAHVGIGSDFDGGFGLDAVPSEIDTIADLQRIGPALAQRGYAQADIQGILSGNFLRMLQRTLPN